MTAHPLATRSGFAHFMFHLAMDENWSKLTKAQRRVLCDLGTATPQPLTRLCELGYVRAVPLARTEMGDALFQWAVRFKGAK